MNGDAATGGEVFAIRTVAVIGAGLAGRSFALGAAAKGFHVVLEDVMPSNLRQAEAEYADLTARDPGAPGRLELATTVEEAVRSADIAIDFVPDELESKLEIFSMIDRMAPPRTILCTPSYALSITDLASCVYRPDRCVAVRGEIAGIAGTRSGSPVQVIHPAGASDGMLAAVRSFLEAMGMAVVVEQDADAPMLVKNLV